MAFIDELKAKQRTDDIVKEIQEEFNRWFDFELQGYVQGVVNGIKNAIVAKVEKGETGNISGEWDFSSGTRFKPTKELVEKVDRYNVSLKLPEGVSMRYVYGKFEELICRWTEVEHKEWTETTGVLFWKKTAKHYAGIVSLTAIAKKIFVAIEKLAAQEGIKLDLNKIQYIGWLIKEGCRGRDINGVLQGVDNSYQLNSSWNPIRLNYYERLSDYKKISIPYSITL